jgi:predicted AlkP superfamily phosphohydrolase/phosphomutase
MRFVLSDPALRMAYWLLLAGAVLFVVTRGRRRQRPVPVVEPPRNRTLEFVRHVGQLYYERGRPLDLARKKMDHFRTFVRRRLDLPADPSTPDWEERVARRAGVPEADVAALADWMDAIQDRSSLSTDALKTLDDCLDTFYDRAAS